ncbi:RpiR family transcriptional regulator [Tetragenococcus halophilus subsp. flandriensis]|uniref:MurR/RpiR family transcriptional regulator n=1 Tax=Tetragenococcus halophilus TaxID=51669 RepID=UPI0023EA2062|nr:MurR/RpiR family transcriptional regulator [Tetragenococcus halophilus]GMA09063.1 RpiR family transcriptional regulator [Tetragenococcus halophilus subsp. flandriensis]
MNFEERVINESVHFTDMEDEIVEYLNEQKSYIEFIKITTLAKKFYTVPNTISRLCHKLGYNGFSDLKHAVKYENDHYVNSKKDNNKLILKNLDIIDEINNKSVIDEFKNAKRINFYSMGQTTYVTRLIVDNFYSIDYKSYFYTYPNELQHIINHGEGELFFFISLSGENQQMIQLAETAKRKRHQLITLTHLSNNSLAKLADKRIFCYSPEQRIDEYNITDKAPVLLIMNSLFREYARQLNKKITLV